MYSATEKLMNTAQGKRIANQLEKLSDAFFVLDPSWKFIFINQQAEQFFGRSAGALIQKNIWTEIPTLKHSELEQHLSLAKDSGKNTEYKEFSERTGRWYRVRISYDATGFYVTLSDITDQQREVEESSTQLAAAQNAWLESESIQQHYQVVAEAMPQIVWTALPDGWVDYFNQRWFGYTSFSIQESQGWGWRQAVHPEDSKRVSKLWRDAVISGREFEMEYRLYCAAQDTYRWQLNRTVPVRNEKGAIIKWIGTCTDINDQKRSEEVQSFLSIASRALGGTLLQEEIFSTICQLAVHEMRFACLIELDTNGTVTTINAQHPDPAIDSKIQSLIDTGKREEIEQVMGINQSESQTIKPCHLQSPLSANSIRYGILHLYSSGVTDCDLHDQVLVRELAFRVSLALDNARLFMAAQRELNERRQIEDELRHQAFHDTLTNLPNRLLFKDRVTTALYRAERNSSLLGILFLDLDQFKSFNDTLGHHVGDLILQETALRITSCLRVEDTVARFGGDEFVILLEDIQKVEDAISVAKKLQGVFKKPHVINNREIYLNTSIGISMYPSDGDDASSLIKNADIALYRAKELGRGTFQLYTRTLGLKRSEKLNLEQDLRKALERDEFRVHYQPVLNTKSGDVISAEALVRWEHPKNGLIFPNEFIPIAEETELILSINTWVFEQVCRDIAAWNKRRPDNQLKISVNLSPRQFSDSQAMSRIIELIHEYNIPSNQLGIELTEGVAMKNVDHTVEILKGLKKAGLTIAIDDFGIGYSSLSYLKRLPLNTLKIDQSFIQSCTVDEQDQAIIRAILSMAHTLKLDVIAEGVETDDQKNFLQSVNCNNIQGFLLSPSLPADKFLQFYTVHTRKERVRKLLTSARRKK